MVPDITSSSGGSTLPPSDNIQRSPSPQGAVALEPGVSKLIETPDWLRNQVDQKHVHHRDVELSFRMAFN